MSNNVTGVNNNNANAVDKVVKAAAAQQSTLGKDAFLQLLVTQMRYQDPLDPQDNAEYLAQLAQFSALEQMTNVADGLNEVMTTVNNIDTSLLVGQLTSMIGKGIQWMPEGSVTPSEGKITAVSITDGAPSVVVQNSATGKSERVSIGEITRIGSLD